MNLDQTYNNRLFLKVEGSKNPSFEAVPPDSYGFSEGEDPPPNFVLCRDLNGTPTAIYGEDLWDFRPYRLATSGNCRMSFENRFKHDGPNKNCQLIEEMKRIVFALIYFVHAGANGSLSVTTLMQYYQVVSRAGAFCVECGNNHMLGSLTLAELFSNKMYLGLYVQSLRNNKRQKQKLNAFYLITSIQLEKSTLDLRLLPVWKYLSQ